MKRAAKALIRDGEGKILVLYRSKTHPHLAHDIDLPGGEIEHLERLERGLSRELVEETGLALKFRRSHRRHVWRPARIARRYHLYQAATSHKVMLVDLKMLCNLFDTSRQNRHLSLWATNVVLVDLSQSNRFVLVIFAYHSYAIIPKNSCSINTRTSGRSYTKDFRCLGPEWPYVHRMFESCQKLRCHQPLGY